MKQVHYILLIIAICAGAHGQSFKILNSLDPLEERGDRSFKNGQYLEAAKLYERVFKKDTAQYHVAIKIAESYYHIDHFEDAEKWFRKGLSADSTEDSQAILDFAQVLMANEKYAEAEKWLLKYQSVEGSPLIAEKKLSSIQNMHRHYEDSSSVEINPLSINTTYAEFSPTYYGFGIVYLSDHHTNDVTNVMGWNEEEYISVFYTEELESGKMRDPVVFHSGLDSDYHEGPLVFYDGNKIIFTRAGVPAKNADESHLELYYAEYDRQKDQWVNMQPLPFNDPNYSVGQPAISKDGNTLVFTSNMPGGYGGADLYIAKKANGQWSEPKNMGEFINSKGDDMFPYLINENELIFSSDGHGGLGELDLFRTPIQASSHDEIENLGYPFNSSYADFGFISDSLGRSGYFTSNRINGGLDDDLFRFRVKWSRIQCIVAEKGLNVPLENVKIDMIVNGAVKDSRYTDGNGSVEFLAQPGEEILLKADKEGYLLGSDIIRSDELFAGMSLATNISLEKRVEKPVKKMNPDEELQALYNRRKAMVQINGRVYEYREVGNSRFIVNADEKIFLSNTPPDQDQSIEERAKLAVEEKGLKMEEMYSLKNIYFDLDTNELTEEGKAELDKVVRIMKVDQHIAFSINSYADSRGSMKYNDELAFKRSQKISRYLLEHDIPGSRLILDSYGEQGLLNDCDDETECEERFHAVNRRSELELVMRKLYTNEE
ncbi:OmpA family protein [Ekhidna sp. MALMAid0563]|uniref:OmpA family protein n=1 Tax=Ekhidna sp. MALMAid0563 TaxID=3143937 RepID=UPI0032DF2CBC